MAETDVKIRLLKTWDNEGTTWPEGQLLGLNEAGAEHLIKEGIAEAYVPAVGDVIKVSPVAANSGTQPKDIEAIVKELYKKETESAVKATKRLGIVDEENFIKTAGFYNMAEFAQHIYQAEVSRSVPEKLAKWEAHCKATGMSEGVSADGGFLVPVEFRANLLKNSLEASIVRGRAMVLPMATNRIAIPVVNDASHASSVYGGIIIYRPAEGGTKTASKPAFGQVELTLHKLVGLCYVTDELLEDSPITLQPLLTTMFAEAIAWQEDEDFINGSGAGQALGVLNSPCLVTVTKETGQAAASIVLKNITKMWSRMYPRGHGKAVWLANSDTFPELAELSVAVGTGGSAAGLIGSDATGAPTNTILGRPVILTEHCQTLGTAGDLILGDWSQYLIGSKATGLKVDTSIHVNFVKDETAFRIVQRYDGQPWWLSALTPKHSSNTLSPFVTLGART